MKLSEVLPQMYAPKGKATVMQALLSANFNPVQEQNAIGKSLTEAKEQLRHYENLQANATSDWAWWGYAGDVVYWDCVVNLLKAAEITGPDNLPFVPFPNMDGVVMDVQSRLQKWGRQVYNLASEKKIHLNVEDVNRDYNTGHEDNWRGD